MIRITREACPTCLTNAPKTGDPWSDSAVRKTLWLMQKTKCCYCERHIPRRGQGAHVEHFRPKETPRFADRRNDWKNLLLACSDCNGNKGEQFPESQGRPILIDPSSPHIDPESHITFVTGEQEFDIPGLIVECNGSRRGHKTIEILRLYHPDYIRARVRFFKKELMPVYERFVKARQRNHKQRIAKAVAEFDALLAASSPYAGFVRAFARNRGLDRDGIRIPV